MAELLCMVLIPAAPTAHPLEILFGGSVKGASRVSLIREPMLAQFPPGPSNGQYQPNRKCVLLTYIA